MASGGQILGILIILIIITAVVVLFKDDIMGAVEEEEEESEEGGSGDGSNDTDVPGCMTQGNIEYNPLATVDDGTCFVPVQVKLGCMDPMASNYDMFATHRGGDPCVTVGCKNPDATNYAPDATEDDGTCMLEGCMNPLAMNYDPSATVDTGEICVVAGCMDSTKLGYDENANLNDGSCGDTITGGCLDSSYVEYGPGFNTSVPGSCINQKIVNGAITPIYPDGTQEECVDEGLQVAYLDSDGNNVLTRVDATQAKCMDPKVLYNTNATWAELEGFCVDHFDIPPAGTEVPASTETECLTACKNNPDVTACEWRKSVNDGPTKCIIHTGDVVKGSGTYTKSRTCSLAPPAVDDYRAVNLLTQAVDTPGWENGVDKTCSTYVTEGWCTDGTVNPEFEWTVGGGFNYPEQNCVACGKGTSLVATQIEDQTFQDTYGWENNNGHACSKYETMGWCVDGGPGPGFEWTVGEEFNYPEKNCIVCGKIKKN